MKKREFILIEMMLAVMVAVTVCAMLGVFQSDDTPRVAVIVPDSDADQWRAFKYGLRLAAEDCGAELFFVGTEDTMTIEEEARMMDHEIENGARALIVQPVTGADMQGVLESAAKKVPVMRVESAAWEGANTPLTGPDDQEMGTTLAGELLLDYDGKLTGKTIGICASAQQAETDDSRRQGLLEGLQNKGGAVVWEITCCGSDSAPDVLEQQSKVDIVIALDDYSLRTAGSCAKENNLHGARVYGIGSSIEAIYYLDIGIAECLVVPDMFDVGYQSLTELAENSGKLFRKVKSQKVAYTVLRRDVLFTKENQELIFAMSQ